MTDKELITLLQQAKDAPEFGGDFTKEKQQASWLKICDSLGWDANQVSQRRFSIFDYLQFAGHELSRSVMQPAAVSFAAFILILGGWTATVNASYSVPGDMLYPVKLATEKVRLTMASTAQARAELHVEFAGRRLKEISEIKDDSLMQAAVSNFNNQMNLVNQELTDIQTNDPDAALAMAVMVDAKANEYEATLGQNQKGDEGVASALEAVSEADNTALDTIVTNHEVTGAIGTAEVLQQNFQIEYTALKSRIVFSLGRLSVIETTLAQDSSNIANYSSRLLASEALVKHAEELIRQAMDTMGLGGYRSAFATLKEAGVKLNQAENMITEMEIELTTPVPEDPIDSANPTNNSFEEVVVPNDY